MELFKMFTPNIKILSETEKATTVQVVGVPYNGPAFLNGKDFHDQKFTKDTKFGRDENGELLVKTVYSYYDHAINRNVGKDVIGVAKFDSETDEGLIWNIEIMRSYRYHDMLVALAKNNLLGASSQPVQTAVEIDDTTGEIKSWQVAEISLTPTPANPNAVVQLLKSLKDVPAEFLVIDADTDTKTDDEPETADLSKRIENLFKDVDAPEAPQTDEALLERLAVLETAVNTLQSELSAAQTANIENIKLVLTQITNLDAGLFAMAKQIAKQLRVEIDETIDQENQKSKIEKDNDKPAPQPRKNVNMIPPGAPGL